MTIRKPTLTQSIFIGMGIGLVLGWIVPDLAVELRPLSTIFLRLIKSIIAPLIFSTLVVGIAIVRKRRAAPTDRVAQQLGGRDRDGRDLPAR